MSLHSLQAPWKISLTFHFWHKSFILDDVKLAELSNNSFEWKNVSFLGVKIYSDPPTYFQGSKVLQTPMIYAPSISCWCECYLELIAQHVAVCVVLDRPRNFTVIAFEESLVLMTWQQPQYDIQPTRYVAVWCEGASSCLVLLLRFHCRDANSWLMLLHLS